MRALDRRDVTHYCHHNRLSPEDQLKSSVGKARGKDDSNGFTLLVLKGYVWFLEM